MTADRAALVERVARRMGEAVSLWLYENPCCKLEDVDTKYIATAAIDLIWPEALEEAARVAEYRCGSPEWSVDTNSGYDCAAKEIAAAIRALKEKPHDR